MSTEKLKIFIIDTISLLKKQALEAKKNAANPKDDLRDYAQGVLMGYYAIINLLKQQAFAFCIDQKELGLEDMKPDVDLLGLHRNPDMDFEEENWAVEVMNEEKAKFYLSDSIKLLKEQAREAKKEADKTDKASKDYNKGHLMAYHSMLSLFKHQAFVLDMDEEDLGLSDIDPDAD